MRFGRRKGFPVRSRQSMRTSARAPPASTRLAQGANSPRGSGGNPPSNNTLLPKAESRDENATSSALLLEESVATRGSTA